ncbi:hypothetical protein Nepgr_027489 [Nepenthes gracilis]|uniref:C2 domain-containing protein n=1 Tax=Nepenthes gracilis TaxID=150966 RepID=A0AAD3TAK9_NEPGR|nr:hypothetical protein Nepgr_027489 [Nepenthes gracilis]
MGSSSLEINAMSCKNLKSFNFFQKLSVYAVVSIGTDVSNFKLNEQQRQEQRTPADKEGDGNPEWKHSLAFDLTSLSHPLFPNDLFLLFEFWHQGQIFGDKLIGEVRVPLKDVVGNFKSGETARFLRYEVRSPDGKPNGVLDFSYKVVSDGVLANQNLAVSGTENTGYQVTDKADHDLKQPAAFASDRDLLPDESVIRYSATDSLKSTTTPSAPPLVYGQAHSHPPPSPIQPVEPNTTPLPAHYSAYHPPPMWPPPPPPPPFWSSHLPPPPPPPPPPPYYHPPFPPAWEHPGTSYSQQYANTGRYDHTRH